MSTFPMFGGLFCIVALCGLVQISSGCLSDQECRLDLASKSVFLQPTDDSGTTCRLFYPEFGTLPTRCVRGSGHAVTITRHVTQDHYCCENAAPQLNTRTTLANVHCCTSMPAALPVAPCLTTRTCQLPPGRLLRLTNKCETPTQADVFSCGTASIPGMSGTITAIGNLCCAPIRLTVDDVLQHRVPTEFCCADLTSARDPATELRALLDFIASLSTKLNVKLAANNAQLDEILKTAEKQYSAAANARFFLGLTKTTVAFAVATVLAPLGTGAVLFISAASWFALALPQLYFDVKELYEEFVKNRPHGVSFFTLVYEKIKPKLSSILTALNVGTVALNLEKVFEIMAKFTDLTEAGLNPFLAILVGFVRACVTFYRNHMTVRNGQRALDEMRVSTTEEVSSYLEGLRRYLHEFSASGPVQQVLEDFIHTLTDVAGNMTPPPSQKSQSLVSRESRRM